MNVVAGISASEGCHFSSAGCPLSLAWWQLEVATHECRQIYAGWPSWLNVHGSFVISTGVTNRTFHWQPQWVFYLPGIFRARLYASGNLSLAQGCFWKRHCWMNFVKDKIYLHICQLTSHNFRGSFIFQCFGIFPPQCTSKIVFL